MDAIQSSAGPRLADTSIPTGDSAPSDLTLSPETLALVENFRESERFTLLKAPFLRRADIRRNASF